MERVTLGFSSSVMLQRQGTEINKCIHQLTLLLLLTFSLKFNFTIYIFEFGGREALFVSITIGVITIECLIKNN